MKKFIIKLFIEPIKKWFNSINDLNSIQKIIYFYCIMLFIVLIGLLTRLLALKYIILLIIALFLIINLYVWFTNRRWAKLFLTNIFIFGGKGKGKDMLMQQGIYFNRKKSNFISNVDYGYNTQVLTNLNDVMNIENTFNNLIENNIHIILKKIQFEGKVLVISDASVYFPSHEDTMLKKHYPSFPLFYALSRQLYNMPVVVNTQVNGRLWKSLREQVQDGYVEALGTYGFGLIWSSIPILRNYVYVKQRFYEKEDSAVRGLLPFKKVAFVNKGLDHIYLTAGGATKEMYEAENGLIRESITIIKKDKIVYDDREFHLKFFGYRFKKEVKDVSSD